VSTNARQWASAGEGRSAAVARAPGACSAGQGSAVRRTTALYYTPQKAAGGDVQQAQLRRRTRAERALATAGSPEHTYHLPSGAGHDLSPVAPRRLPNAADLRYAAG
jgi:hypothetical protein